MIITISEPVNAIKRVSLAAPEMADAAIISTRQVYLMGKAVGVTNLTLWDKDDHVLAILNVEVSLDLSRIRAKLREILPDENIRVTATNDVITLFGEVSSATSLEMAMRIAQAYAQMGSQRGAPKVINLMRVAGVQQDQPTLSPFLLDQLKAKLREILPDENVRVTATNNTITLFGEVSSTTNLEMAMRIAQAYTPKVINLMRVAGVQQDQPALSPFLLDQLKAKLREILPDENIRVTATNDAITLFGEVSSTARLSQAVMLAEAYAPKKVINLLQVSGVQQVMLEVRVAEMARSLTRRWQTSGLNLQYGTLVGDAALRFGLLNELAALASPATALFSFNRAGLTLAGIIDALKEKGLVKILAEPTLITLSGQEASFLAGGEFPIPVPQGNQTLSIEFKSFGVGLIFTPTVLSKDKISLKVAPEVSALDFTSALRNAGFVVPGLTVRRASTVIELADGQSFAIAGLLNENVRELVSKFPVLGDIPILGALFRSSEYEKNETELIIIVTPHLVRPVDLSQQPLPTDPFIEPNDFEFYLQGMVEGEAAGQGDNKRLDGEFGYLYGPSQEAQ